jgi:hypothetical protein
LTISSATGTKAFNGDVTVNSGGTWNNTAANVALTLPGSISNAGTFNAGTGVYTLSGTGKTISGTLSIPSVTVSGTYTNNGTLTVSTALSGTGGLTQGTSATLNIGGTSGITTLTATATDNTVNYSGAGQTVRDVTYHHLITSGSGTKTLVGTANVAGNLTINGGTFDLGTYTIDRATSGGTLTVAIGAGLRIGGTGTLPSNYSTHSIGATSTIEYYGTAQTVAVLNSSQNYGNLILSGSGTKTLAGTGNVAGDLTINGGTFDLGTYTIDRATSGGTLTVASGAGLRIGGTGTLPSYYSIHSINAASTIEYYGTAQTVAVLNSSQNYGNLILSGSGVKTLQTGTTTISGSLTLSGTASTTTVVGLTIGGNLVIGDGTTFEAAGFALTVTGTTTVGGGTSGNLVISSATGTKIFTGLVTVSADGTWNNSGNSPITFRNGISNSGNFNAGTGVHTFQTNAQALTGTFSIPNVTTTITLTNNNTLTVGTALSGTGGLTQGTGAILNLGGTSLITTLTATATGNTVNYNGVAQTVHNNNYYHLTLSGSGAKTLQTSTTTIGGNLILSGTASATTVVGLGISGNLVIADGTTFTAAGFALTVTGTTTVGDGTSGNLAISGTGTKTFTGDVTINSGGTWNETAAAAISFGGSLQNNGTSTANTGVHTFTGAIKTFSGANAISIPSVTVSGTYTNNGTLTVGTALSGTGGLTQGTSATLNIGGTSGITTLTATATGNTVNYNGTAQTVKAITYYNLTLSGSGIKTLTGLTTINGDFTLSGTATATAASGLIIGGSVSIGAGTTFNGGALTHYVGGNWSNSGTFTAGTSTITFNSAVAQTINNNNTWYNLAVTTSTARTVYFQSGVTQTIGTGGSITFTGASGQLLTLAPLTGGSAWNLIFNGATQSVSYVSVSWSNAGDGSTIYAYDVTNTDGGNNTNWKFAAVTYYSQGSVDANTPTNWNTIRGGGGTSPANFTGNDNFVIQNGHSMTTSAAWTVPGALSKVQIESGGALTASTGDVNAYVFQVDSGGTTTINSGRTLTINNSTSDPDLIVNGTLVNSGTITLSSSTMSVGSTGTYRHAQNGGTIPTATWDVASTVEVTGWTSSTSNPVPSGQTYGNFKWNSTSQTATVSLAGRLTTVNGNLTVASTGTGQLELAYSEAFTLTIGGDLIVQAGSLYAAVMYSLSTPQYTLNINGNLIVQGGVLDFCHGSYSIGDSSNPIINLGGNYNQSGGTVTAYAGLSSPPALPFNFTGANKTFTKTAGTFTGHYMAFHVANGASLTLNNSFSVGTSATDLLTVDSGGTLNVGSYADSKYVLGSGNFMVASGGTLGIGDPYGILMGTGTGATSGSIQVTGSRTYNTGANYIYNGSVAQVTGNGLPATVNNLTINNAAGVALSSSVTVSGTLTLTSGTFTVGTNTLTLNGPAIAGTPSNLATTSSSSLAFGGSSVGVSVPSSVTQLNNLTINNAAGVALSGSVTVSGTLTLTLGTFTVGANTLTLNGPAIAGTPSNLVTTSLSSLAFGGSSAGVSVPSSVTQLNNLTINNAAGVTLSGSVTVSGTLTLTSGNINAGSYTLTIGASGSVSRTSGHVVGKLQKSVSLGSPVITFEVGTGASYTPVNITFNNVTGTVGTLTVNSTSGDHASISTSGINASESVNRYWTITNSGVTFTSYDAMFTFVAGDLDAGANTADFIVKKFNSPNWTWPPGGVTAGALSTTGKGFTSFSDFAVGEPAFPNPVPTTTSISPTIKNAGEAGFTMTVNGTNFVGTSVVRFAGVDKATTYVNSNQLTAWIPDTDLATPGTFNITVFNPTFTPSSLGEAVDNTALRWTTGGSANWFAQTTTYYYGGDAAQSGDIGDSQSTWLQTGVTGPGNLTFYWKVSSENTYDFLRFYIDGSLQTGSISGTVDWQQKSYSIGNGTHTLQWIYIKDTYTSSGSDCGWLDKVAFAAGGTSNAQTFTVNPVIINTPPTVGTITAPASMTPQQEWTVITVPVTDVNTIADVKEVKVTVFYDSAGTHPAAPGSANVQTCAILTWTRSTGTWTIDQGTGTTWAINSGGCTKPADSASTGDWVFSFKVGKVATETIGSADWDIYALATDTALATGNNRLNGVAMNWYGEITVNTANINWGNVALGSDFSANSKTDILVTYICNGNYSEQVKSSSPWSNGGNSVTLNAAGSPGNGEFSLKADDTAVLSSAALVTTSYVTIDTGTQTNESGNIETSNSLWLKLGALGIPAVQYSGTIYYGIAQ